jgi:hypothetical protein
LFALVRSKIISVRIKAAGLNTRTSGFMRQIGI